MVVFTVLASLQASLRPYISTVMLADTKSDNSDKVVCFEGQNTRQRRRSKADEGRGEGGQGGLRGGRKLGVREMLV